MSESRVRKLAEDALQAVAESLGVNPGELDPEDVEATTELIEGMIARWERNAFRRGEREGARNPYA